MNSLKKMKKKFIVETYYTCTFKTVHTLDELNDDQLSKIDSRNDGKVEVIDVKLNSRKTKKVGDKSEPETDKLKKVETINQNIISNPNKNKIQNNDLATKIKSKMARELKCLTEEKDIYKKPQ